MYFIFNLSFISLFKNLYFSFQILQNGSVIVDERNLDRENKSSYSLTVIAKDPGNRSSKTELTVTIEDCNDETPVFTHKDIKTSIREGSQYFTPQLQVKVSCF